MLVDGCGSVHPEEELDVEARVFIDHDLRLAEGGIGLRGMVLVQQEVAHECGEIDLLGRGVLVECGAGDLGEFGEGEFFAFPKFKDHVTQLLEEGVHRRTLPWRWRMRGNGQV